MDDLIYNALNILFGKGIMSNLSDIMGKLLELLVDLLSYENGTSAPILKLSMEICGTLAISFLTVAFLWRLVSQGARGVVTFEMVAENLIRLCVVMFIIINLPEILSLIMQFSKSLYDNLDKQWGSTVQNAFGINVTQGGDLPFTRKDLTEFSSRFSFVEKMLPCLVSIVVVLCGLIATVFGIFFCMSNAVLVLLFAFLTPLGICACAGEEHHDFGMRVLKRFLATTLTMPVYAAALQLIPFLNTKIVASRVEGLEGGITKDNYLEALSLSNVGYLLVPQLTAIGISGSCTMVTKEILGV